MIESLPSHCSARPIWRSQYDSQVITYGRQRRIVNFGSTETDKRPGGDNGRIEAAL
jgi:hypothetical protein